MATWYGYGSRYGRARTIAVLERTKDTNEQLYKDAEALQAAIVHLRHTVGDEKAWYSKKVYLNEFDKLTERFEHGLFDRNYSYPQAMHRGRLHDTLARYPGVDQRRALAIEQVVFAATYRGAYPNERKTFTAEDECRYDAMLGDMLPPEMRATAAATLAMEQALDAVVFSLYIEWRGFAKRPQRIFASLLETIDEAYDGSNALDGSGAFIRRLLTNDVALDYLASQLDRAVALGNDDDDDDEPMTVTNASIASNLRSVIDARQRQRRANLGTHFC